MQTEILQVRSDILFHDLFNEKDIKAVEWVASQILECDVKELKGKVSVKNVRLTRTNKKERTKYVDLIVEYEKQKIVIELNNNYEGIYTRNLNYAFNTLLNFYNNNGCSYYERDAIFKVILVNLNWYKNKNLEIPGKKIHTIPYPDEKIDDNILTIININLDYYEELSYDNVVLFDRFFKLLTVDSKEKLEQFSSVDELDAYSKNLEYFSNNKEYVEELMRAEAEEIMRNQEKYFAGFHEGEAKGEAKAKAEAEAEIAEVKAEIAEAKAAEQKMKETQTLIVKNLLNKNMTDLEIIEITNISKEELDNIKKELK